MEHDIKYLNKNIGQFSCADVVDILPLFALFYFSSHKDKTL